ncbi:FHA domain containing protein [Nitrospira japonica]|uniref:FHA domain containing protein n=1 Tax=Nitrospira japonica TaxID=1325564 RepID=A0A1W1I720_9BACT|nr:FHA domain-containing protein [Nitrospira japonica]SLM48806.1 FHA domain containing protein [Nitrospira japonica]
MAHTTDAPAKLLVKLHGQGSRTIEIMHDVYTIGRKTGNDLSIDDHTVSGHHARIVKVQAVYFLEDLNSTNGSSVNGMRVDRHQLRDSDVITIGQHRIIFQEPAAPAAAPPSPSSFVDETMAISGGESGIPAASLSAKVVVTDGSTERPEYLLNKPVSSIGSQQGAAIRLTGWFAPKFAAQIIQRGGAYFVSLAQGGKTLLVNGRDVTGQQQLRNGDHIQVAGVSLTFYWLGSRK